jgi:hypothetical protein
MLLLLLLQRLFKDTTLSVTAALRHQLLATYRTQRIGLLPNASL